ncbi:MAG: hypothetical protein IJ943_00575 [Akkermansia sp.]|nr:hypothetical protein [Akkermansia sp.]
MNIPHKLYPLGNTLTLPVGYIELDFLESTGEQYINTDYIPDNNTGISCIHEYRSASDTIIFGCRNSASTETRFYCTRGVRSSEHTATDGFGWGQWTIIRSTIQTIRTRLTGSLNWLNSMKARHPIYHTNLTELPYRPNCPLYLFAANIGNQVSLAASARIWRAGISAYNHIVHYFIPALTSDGIPCMYCPLSKKTIFNEGNGSPLVAGVASIEALRKLLIALPSTGGDIKLSLPSNANTPDLAEQMALTAATKGWTLTIYEYRKNVPATYSLRRVREGVWCRKTPSEHGRYADNSGKRWQVEYCADIFTPHGHPPSELGYELFETVNEATENWGLYLMEESATTI